MADVAADLDRVVATNRAWQRLLRVGRSEHRPSHLDGILALPHHARDRAAQHVLQQAREELLLHEVAVVLLQQILVGLKQLQCLELVATLLEPLDD